MNKCGVRKWASKRRCVSSRRDFNWGDVEDLGPEGWDVEGIFDCAEDVRSAVANESA